MCHGLKALLLRLVTSFIQRDAKKINKPVLEGLIFDVLWVFLKKLFLCERRQNFWHDILNKYMKAFTFPSSQSKYDVTDETKETLQWKQIKLQWGSENRTWLLDMGIPLIQQHVHIPCHYLQCLHCLSKAWGIPKPNTLVKWSSINSMKNIIV